MQGFVQAKKFTVLPPAVGVSAAKFEQGQLFLLPVIDSSLLRGAGKRTSVTITIKNPLPVALTGGKASVTVSGSYSAPEVLNVKKMSPGETVTLTVKGISGRFSKRKRRIVVNVKCVACARTRPLLSSF